jgi:hypothetical protein
MMRTHYSHNVSSSFFTCYGCGLEAGDQKLEQPCPTPDLVGQSRIEHVKKPLVRDGICSDCHDEVKAGEPCSEYECPMRRNA